MIEKQTNSLFCEQPRWIHTCHFISQDDCHTLCRPVPSFIKGGLSTVSQGSALAPMTGTIVKVGFSSDIWPESLRGIKGYDLVFYRYLLNQDSMLKKVKH